MFMALNETATEPWTGMPPVGAVQGVVTIAPGAGLGESDLEWFARRFPLVPHRAPICLELAERIASEVPGPVDYDQVVSIHGDDTVKAVAKARIALDRAVVIASDCRRPEVAIDLCRRHLDIYTALDGPVRLTTTAGMLEPARNLVRLLSLRGQTDQAVALVTELASALRTGRPAMVSGASLPLDRIQGTREELQRRADHARYGLLADGIKAYALAGRWADAAYLVEDLDGLSPHLTEPRQALIMASLTGQDLDGARRHLAAAVGTERWEEEIASCLAVLVAAPADRPVAAEAMVTAFWASEPDSHLAVYRARYGVTTALLAHASGHQDADDVARQVVAEAIQIDDAHAAYEVLRHLPGGMPPHEREVLEGVVDRSGLAGDRLTDQLLTALLSGVQDAVTTLEEALY